MVTRTRTTQAAALVAATLISVTTLAGVSGAQEPRPAAPAPAGSSAPATSTVAGAPAASSSSASSSSVSPPSTPPAPGPEPVDAADASAPRLHHAPVSVAPAGREIVVTATIEHPQRVKRVVLAYRTLGSEGAWKEVPFQRAASGPYVAVVPGEAVEAPGLAYVVELETVEGVTRALFATRAAPHHVQVTVDRLGEQERLVLARLGGRRSVVTTSAEYAYFGKVAAPPSQVGATPAKIADQYYRIESGYTYRMLGLVSEFGIRGGVVRGRSVVPGETNHAKYDVGLNYGAPTVRFRAADWLHVEGELLTSITEVGFSVGGGAAVLIGDPYGSKLTLGFESIQVFGTRAWSRMDLAASSRVLVAPIIEVTDMPHAARTGVRLLTEVQVDAGNGWGFAVRGGYQARDAATGGPSFGGTVAYAF